jgi:hypothetical protein
MNQIIGREKEQAIAYGLSNAKYAGMIQNDLKMDVLFKNLQQ